MKKEEDKIDSQIKLKQSEIYNTLITKLDNTESSLLKKENIDHELHKNIDGIKNNLELYLLQEINYKKYCYYNCSKY